MAITNKPKAWSKDEVAYLKRCYKKYQIKEIAKVLGRTQYAIESKIAALDLHDEYWDRKYTAKPGKPAPTFSRKVNVTASPSKTETVPVRNGGNYRFSQRPLPVDNRPLWKRLLGIK